MQNTATNRHLTVADFESDAQHHLSAMAYEYLRGGVGEGSTLTSNRSSFERIHLNPRVLVDVSNIDTSITLLGRQYPFPILLAPTGYHKFFHSDGEFETVRGADLCNAHLIAASFSTVSFEEMSETARNPLSFQLYFHPEREFTERIVERVIACGCASICVTVDVPVNGPRDRELKANFALPAGVARANFEFLGANAGAPDRPTGRNIYSAMRSPSVTWKDLEWLRSITPVPLMIKGILNAPDAVRAVDCGCDAVIVSNHGGRSVDTLPASIDVLPRVVAAVSGRVPVLMDGGVRRGTDIFKALALGAAAVLVGRPYLYGLAVSGALGIERVINILRTELEMTMGLSGCRTIPEIDLERLWKSV